jgi:glycosyltransferase involved in cell wall biosynthesis
MRPDGPHMYIGELDIADGLTDIPGADADGLAWTGGRVLVRCFTEPVGILQLDIPAEGIPVAAIAKALDNQLGDRLRSKLRESGVDVNGALPQHGLGSVTTPTYMDRRDEALVAAPEITVAICTHDRPQLLHSSLTSLQGQIYPKMRVLVVDNAPSDGETRRAAAAHADKLDLEYVVEPKPGLSWARNRAIDVSSTDIIASLDDDEQADRWWVAELAWALVAHPEAGAVSGIILPAEIESLSQLWFEQGGGHTKGRGFDPLVFSPATRRTQSPLYPRPQFGTGGNMAFRREAIEEIGRFNTALGAGTAVRGAEDTSAFSEFLYRGGTMIYHPAAVVWHTHRRGVEQLRALKRGYGRGISAFYLSFLIKHPAALGELVRLLPKALHDLAHNIPDPDHLPAGEPSEPVPQFDRELFRGLLEGAPMYLLAAWQSHRLARVGAEQ